MKIILKLEICLIHNRHKLLDFMQVDMVFSFFKNVMMISNVLMFTRYFVILNNKYHIVSNKYCNFSFDILLTFRILSKE